MWVCQSRDLLGRKWTSAVSEVLSCEITDLIKSSPSHSLLLHLPHLYVTWHRFTSPIHHTIWLFFSLTFLYNLRHPHHTVPFCCPPLPAAFSGSRGQKSTYSVLEFAFIWEWNKPWARSDLRRSAGPIVGSDQCKAEQRMNQIFHIRAI